MRRALAWGAGYVPLIASGHRARLVLDDLALEGVEGLDRIRTPAGLEIGAATPEEIALSVIGQIVAFRRGAGSPDLKHKAASHAVVGSCAGHLQP